MSSNERLSRIDVLRRSRPVRPFVRWSLLVFLSLAGWSWVGGQLVPRDLLSERRLASLSRFLGELTPYPLRETGVSVGGLLGWAADLWTDRGFSATLTTLSISIVAMVLASGLAAILTPAAVRTLATAEPFLPSSNPTRREVTWLWKLVVASTRSALAFLRAIPEYIWVFLLIGVFGPTAWPAILALMLHNAGILGRLNAEVIEDLEPSPLVSLRAAGASRLEIAGWGIVPLALPRMLLFFFYRWESCVREATIVGLLGVVSIGFWIQDARARQQPDTMLFYILLGALLVILGDVLSAVARRWVREAR